MQIPIFVINMDKDLHRWESVQEQAQKYNLPLERVGGIESKDIPKSDIEFVTSGVRAVWMSHMKCVKLFLESSSTHAIVAEDDFFIIEPKNLFSTLRNEDLLAFDVVQLGWVTPGLDNIIRRKYSDIEHLLFRNIHKLLTQTNSKSQILNRLRVRSSGNSPKGFVPDDFQPGGHFYLVSRRFAESILKMNEPQFLATDDLYIALARMRSLKFIRSIKNLVVQKPFEKWSGSRFLNH